MASYERICAGTAGEASIDAALPWQIRRSTPLGQKKQIKT
jgi:hypothetical protein